LVGTSANAASPAAAAPPMSSRRRIWPCASASGPALAAASLGPPPVIQSTSSGGEGSGGGWVGGGVVCHGVFYVGGKSRVPTALQSQPGQPHAPRAGRARARARTLAEPRVALGGAAEQRLAAVGAVDALRPRVEHARRCRRGLRALNGGPRRARRLRDRKRRHGLATALPGCPRRNASGCVPGSHRPAVNWLAFPLSRHPRTAPAALCMSASCRFSLAASSSAARSRASMSSDNAVPPAALGWPPSPPSARAATRRAARRGGGAAAAPDARGLVAVPTRLPSMFRPAKGREGAVVERPEGESGTMS
jgi:hypothetical protein